MTTPTIPLFPDRRPAYFLGCYSGVYDSPLYPEESKYGIADWFKGPEGVDHLITKIDNIVAMGYRRILLNRPMGGIQGLVCASCNLTIPNYKRAAILSKLKPHVADLEKKYPGFQFGVYVGGAYTKLDSLVCKDGDPLIYDSASLPDYLTNFAIWQPWAKIIAFDFSSPAQNLPTLKKFDKEFAIPHGLKTIGEAIPETANDDGVAFMARTKFIMTRKGMLDKVWNPKTSECHWWLQVEAGLVEKDWTSEQAKDFIRKTVIGKGWIPMGRGSYDKEIIEVCNEPVPAISHPIEVVPVGAHPISHPVIKGSNEG